MTTKIEQLIDVQVPVAIAYNQWTQFEQFPRFMEGIEEVKQLDDKHLTWRANIGGKTEEWSAHVTEQVPDMRIAWRSDTGIQNAGVVTFHRLSDSTSRIMLQLEYDPQGIVENVGDFIGMTQRRIKGDLERFKAFIENRDVETGAWRGEIPRPDKSK
jgi:uncharacterized membrane protein